MAQERRAGGRVDIPAGPGRVVVVMTSGGEALPLPTGFGYCGPARIFMNVNSRSYL